MAKKEKRRREKSGGFTAVETVVAVVVLSILSAYAIPKLFGLKDQADATEETLKIKDIEARHTQEILKAGKRGYRPRLGDVVGFRPEVVSEPTPETAPLLVDYSFAFFSESPTSTTPEGGWIAIHPGIGSGSRSDAFDYPASDEQMLCDGVQIWRRFRNTSDPTRSYLIPSTPSVFQARSFEASIVSGGPSSGALPSDEIPKCRAIYRSISVTNIAANQTQTYLDALRARPGHVEWISSTGRLYHYSDLSPVREDWTLRSMADAPGTSSRVRDILPQKWRATCTPHVEKYGAPYVLSGLTNGWSTTLPTHFGGTGIRSMAGDNGKEKSHWGHVAGTNLRVIQEDPLISAVDGRPLTEILGGARCERVGEAPAPPPADPGDPGAYPMATDGSGYCLSPGRKLPTYRDSSGTPTSSASDPVVELATEAVDDPTNCP